MDTRERARVALVVALAAVGWSVQSVRAAPLGTAFTYQGQLQQSGLPADGTCDFEFNLWDAAGSGTPPTGGSQIGGTQTVSAVSVSGGLFTVQLNSGNEFGSSAFAGDDRWLYIRVRCPAGAGSYTGLSPRQKLTAAPYALYAPDAGSAGSAGSVPWTGLTGVPAGFGDNVDNDTTYTAGTGLTLAGGQFSVNTTVIQARVTGSCAGGSSIRVIDAGGAVTCETDDNSGGTVTSITAGAGLTGGTITNSGTIAANFGVDPGTVAAGDHDHFGQNWTGSTGTGLTVTNYSGGSGSVGVLGFQGFLADTWGMGTTAGILAPPAGVWGGSIDGNGVFGETFDVNSAGVYGRAYNPILLTTAPGDPRRPGSADEPSGGAGGGPMGGVGVHGFAAMTAGVWGESTNGIGVQGTSNSGPGVIGVSNGSGNGVFAGNSGSARYEAAVYATNDNAAGGMAGYFTNQSNFATAHFANEGTGEVLYLQNGGSDAAGTGGGDFIKCVNDPELDAQFRILTSGEVRSDVGFNTPAADFAEMLLAEEGLEPGDVLAAGPDGRLIRSSDPRQSSVVGVYSTNPGFVGGMPVNGDAPGTVPLAVVGVVPVKASAENGPIRPGDLLVASSTPGHAMAAGAAPEVGTVIGKSLDQLASGAGVIRMLVTLQ